MVGDGVTAILHCEFARDEDCEGKEPDAAPVYCVEIVTEAATPRTDYAFGGDASVGVPPSCENWDDAVAFAKRLERDLIAATTPAWRPLSTAPKDGTRILGFADGDITTVKWTSPGEYWQLCVCGAYAEDAEWWPTHWMPLPSDPKDTPT